MLPVSPRLAVVARRCDWTFCIEHEWWKFRDVIQSTKQIGAWDKGSRFIAAHISCKYHFPRPRSQCWCIPFETFIEIRRSSHFYFGQSILQRISSEQTAPLCKVHNIPHSSSVVDVQSCLLMDHRHRHHYHKPRDLYWNTPCHDGFAHYSNQRRCHDEKWEEPIVDE